MPDRRVTLALKSIAANVRRTRLRRGLTQEQLAERSGIEARTVQLLESGHANPTAAVMVMVAVALDIEPGTLFRLARIGERPAGRPRRERAK
jgi:transcriptional regulator with XRE-family HTH domain